MDVCSDEEEEKTPTDKKTEHNRQELRSSEPLLDNGGVERNDIGEETKEQEVV
jgi:hypothetical protein